MNFTNERNFARWFIIIFSLLIVALILWNTSIFFERLKQDERDKMELWTAAQAFLDKATGDTDIDLTLKILNTNTTIPTIWINEKGEIVDGLNIPIETRGNQKKLDEYFTELKSENEPIEMVLGKNEAHKNYYGDSPVITSINNYPIGFLLFLFLFQGVAYFFYIPTTS